MKKITLLVLVSVIALVLLVGCDKKESTSKKESSKIKVALIVNQRFGDNGPMDDLAQGVEKAGEDFGVEIKKLESVSAAKFEDDIRAMSKNYNLIITTFPYMSDATKLVAKEYPDNKYVAIFQFINNEPESFDNIWDTEFHGEQAFYLSGYIAGIMTKSKKVGLVIGAEEPTPNAEGNAFMQGVKDANANASVEFAFVGSYEDPAKAKEITSAMIAKGCDVVQANAGASNAGVVEACKEAGILVSSEITDFYATYKGFYGVVGIGFGQTAYTAIEMVVEGTFEGGKRGIRDLSNGGYYMKWETYERFVAENDEHGQMFQIAIDEAKKLEANIKSGNLSIPFNTEVPNWNNFK